MNIDELKNSAVDITPMGEIIPDPQETEIQTEEVPEPTPEEKAETEKFLRSALIRKHGWILRDLYNRMHKMHYTVDQIKEEIQQKQSTLSASQRDFVLNFKTDFLEELLKDMYNHKALHEINLA